MEDSGSPEPILDAATREEIELAQFEVHKRYARELQPLLSVLRSNPPMMGGLSALKFLTGEPEPSEPPEIPLPPRPRATIKFCRILESYGRDLFNETLGRYPREFQSPSWRTSLANRVERIILRRIADIERKTWRSLSYHATTDEMRQAIREGLRPQLGIGTESAQPGDPAANQEPRAPDAVSVQPPVLTIKDQLRALFDEAVLYPSAATRHVGITVKSIYRHLNGETFPREQQLEAYERFFSGRLGRPIKLKRQRKVTETPLVKPNVTEKSP
jgi:hypothetical protein